MCKIYTKNYKIVLKTDEGPKKIDMLYFWMGMLSVI